MPVEYRTGDLFAQPDITALAHGCNCAGAMGKGIAVEFKKRYPKMYGAYKSACATGTFDVGDVFTWREGARTVFNLGTQAHWRTDAKLDWIERSLNKMIAEADALGITKIAMPRIGAGLGGVAWSDVRALLERVSADTSVTLVVVSLPGAT